MKANDVIYVVCKYERWSGYWFKALVNYIISNKLALNKFNARHKSLAFQNDSGKPISVFFVSETAVKGAPRLLREYVRTVDWDGDDVDELYNRIMEASNG